VSTLTKALKAIDPAADLQFDLAAHRLSMDAESAVKMPGTAGDVLAHAAMLGMVRAAARRR